MKKLGKDMETRNVPADIIDIIINICRYGALAFAALAVYFIYGRQQAVLWPAFVSLALLVAGVLLAYIPKKVKTGEGDKDRKLW